MSRTAGKELASIRLGVWALLAACACMAGSTRAVAQEQEPEKEADAKAEGLSPEQQKALQLFRSIKWQKGPATADLGNTAEIKLPEGYQFTGAEGGRIFEELNENPPSENLLGILAPADSLDWFVVFEYEETGYVKDDEKDKIDANAILGTIRQGTEQSNAYRRSKGWDEIHNIGWQVPPAYDPTSHNLVWATKFDTSGHQTVNYSTRILGRRGVINANLVTNPQEVNQVIPTVKGLLSGLEYKAGLRYAEFRSGDKIAAYGLTALITGGAAAVAVKTGLLAKLGVLLAKSAKVVFGGIAVVVSMIFGTRKKKA